MVGDIAERPSGQVCVGASVVLDEHVLPWNIGARGIVFEVGDANIGAQDAPENPCGGKGFRGLKR
jgi:hypothetical protein